VVTLRRVSSFALADDSQVAVRSAAPADARGVCALLDAVAAEPDTPLLHVPCSCSVRTLRAQIDHAATDPRDLMLVAQVDGDLVGHLSLAGDRHPYSGHVCEIGLAVRADRRGKGVGSALLDVALPWAARRPYSKVVAGVFPHNRPALRFFAVHGFLREGQLHAHYAREGGTYDEVLMARPLDIGDRRA
jgi:L-phenylalanine/L-methionine N-acetyltransferase